MADVFISYARADKTRVAPIVAAIEARGWSVWWDPEISAGQEFDQRIAAELRDASAVLVVWSPESVASRWVRGEAREGAERGILVPVSFSGASPPIDLRALHTTAFDDWAGDRDGPQMREVIRALDAIIARPRPAAALPQPIVPTRGPGAAAAVPRRGRIWRFVGLGALAIAAAAAALLLWRGDRSGAAAARPPVTSLIVLPFGSQSPGRDETYFADGMTDALITDLARIPSLKVISRTSSFHYQALGMSSQDLARELGVQVIVDGTVLHAGGQVRISVRLVDAATDRNLWGQQYTRQVGDVLALQADVARSVAGEIRRSFSPADEARLAAAAPLDPQAVEAYLKGRYQWNRRTPAALLSAAEEFRKAIALEPDYALAHAGLAQALVLLPAFPLGIVSPVQALPEARREAEAALALDERLAEAHAVLGYERLTSLDRPAAEASFQRAVDVNPNYATAHFWYAAALASVERHDEALAQARLAQSLDPASPIIVSGTAWIHHLARRFDQEVEVARSALLLDPNFMMARYRLAEGLLHLGQFDAAVREMDAALSLANGNPDLVATLAYARARAGRTREAREGLRRLLDMNADPGRYVSPLAIALVHVGLGEFDDAFAWIDRAIEMRAWGVAFLGVEADFDPLRSDPRMAAVLSRIGFTPARSP